MFEEEKRINLERRDFKWTLAYVLMVFCYSLALLLVIIQTYEQQPELNHGFVAIIENWKTDIIDDFSLVNDGASCPQEYEDSLSQTFNYMPMKLWVVNGKAYKLCQRRLVGVNFGSSYLYTPKCNKVGDQLCGGVENEMKMCVSNKTQCPINDLKINSSNLTSPDYFELQKVDSTYSLFGSTLSNNYQITKLVVSYGPGVCSVQGQFVSQINSEFYGGDTKCGQIDPSYRLLASTNAKQFLELNKVFSTAPEEFNSKTVGLYALSYAPFQMSCRHILDKLLSSEQTWKKLDNSIPAALIIIAIYLGFVAIILNMILVIQSPMCPVELSDDESEISFVKQVSLICRILAVLTLSSSVISVYFLAQSLNTTISTAISQKCLNDQSSVIFSETSKRLDTWRQYIIPLFWIWVAAFVIEFLALYVYIYHSISNKRKNLRKMKEEQNMPEIEYEVLPTEQNDGTQRNRKVASPNIIIQRPSFNPNEQQQIRMSIHRMSLHPRKTLQHPEKIDEEDSPKVIHRDVSFKPNIVQKPIINTLTTPTANYDKEFETFHLPKTIASDAKFDNGNSPNFIGSHQRQISSIKMGSESEFVQ